MLKITVTVICLAFVLGGLLMYKKSVSELIIELFKKILGIGGKTLTYEETMRYFAEHKDDSEHIIKGIVIREPSKASGNSGKRWTVILAFLDKDNKTILKDGVPLGIKYVDAEIDDELRQTFGTKDTIIIE